MDHVNLLRDFRDTAKAWGGGYPAAIDAAIAALSAKPEGEAVAVQGQAECTCHYMAPRNCPYTPHNSEPDMRSHGVVVDEAMIDRLSQAWFGRVISNEHDRKLLRDALVAALGEGEK